MSGSKKHDAKKIGGDMLRIKGYTKKGAEEKNDETDEIVYEVDLPDEDDDLNNVFNNKTVAPKHGSSGQRRTKTDN